MKLIELQRLAQKVKMMVAAKRGTTGQIYFVDRVAQYRDIWRAVAAELGAELEELAPDMWQINKGDGHTRINNYRLQLDDPVTLELAGRKPVVHGLLRRADLAVPEHARFGLDSLDVAHRFVAAHPLGSVIKPADGYGGKGVTTHITDGGQIRDAAVLASVHSRDLMIEAQIVGECFRVLVFDDEVLSAVRRTGVRLTGDGVSTIASLLTRRGLPVDADCRFTLEAQDLALDRVVRDGDTVLVKSNRAESGATELRTVYDTEVTAEIHGDVAHVARQAARIVGSRFCGVDIITADVTRPLREVRGCVNEVNTTPALHHHYDSETEPFPAVALTIVRRLLEESPPEHRP